MSPSGPTGSIVALMKSVSRNACQMFLKALIQTAVTAKTPSSNAVSSRHWELFCLRFILQPLIIQSLFLCCFFQTIPLITMVLEIRMNVKLKALVSSVCLPWYSNCRKVFA